MVPKRFKVASMIIDGIEIQVDRGATVPLPPDFFLRFHLDDSAVLQPLGLAYLCDEFQDDRAAPGTLRLLTWFHESRETIDFPVVGNLFYAADHGYHFQLAENNGFLHAPIFKRVLVPFDWSLWHRATVFDHQEAAEQERHQAEVVRIRRDRAEFLSANFTPFRDRSWDYSRGTRDTTPGTLWANLHDQLAVLLGSGGDGAQMLFADGHRELVNLNLGRWAQMPADREWGRKVVLDRRLWMAGPNGTPTCAEIHGTGPFAGAGRRGRRGWDKWSYEVHMTTYEYAVRVAAAMGWAEPSPERISEADSKENPESLFVAGEVIRVPYRKGFRKALICEVVPRYGWIASEHGGAPRPNWLLVRDEGGRQYVILDMDVLAFNPRERPPFLGGPIVHGHPESPYVLWSEPDLTTKLTDGR